MLLRIMKTLRRGFDILAIFDIDENKVGKQINNIDVMHMNTLDDFASKNKIDIAMLTVPNKILLISPKGYILRHKRNLELLSNRPYAG